MWVGNIHGKLLIQQNCGLFSPVKVISFDLLTFHQITFHQNIELTRSALCSDWSDALVSAPWLAGCVSPPPLIVKLNRNKVSSHTDVLYWLALRLSEGYQLHSRQKKHLVLIIIFISYEAKKTLLEKVGAGSGWEMICGRVSQRMIFLIHRCCFCQVSSDQVAESGSCVGHHLVVFLTRYQVTSSGLYFHLTRHGRL